MALVKFSSLLPSALSTRLGLGTTLPTGSATLTAQQLAGVAIDTARKVAAGVIAPTIKEGGGAARMGTATLITGAKVVATTAVTANSRVFITVQSLGTVSAPKAVAVTARTPGTSFTITSADGTDTSVVAWKIVEPAS